MEKTNSSPDPNPPPPEESGTQGTQLEGDAITNLPSIPRGELPPGLAAGNVMELAAAINLRHQQARDMLQVMASGVDRELESRQTRVDRLQKELTDEQVAHARSDERLRSGQMQSGAQAMLSTIGGVAFGYGLAQLESNTSFGVLVSIVGIAMIAIGCWPIISLRWKPRGVSKPDRHT